jgi:V/A-type H+-transporting ATPase subunit B
MKDGIGEGRTRADHSHVADQLYAAYAHTQDVRGLADVIGEDELSEVDRQYLRFGERFEHRFVHQDENEDRTIDASLDLAWQLIDLLPRDELSRLAEAEIEEHLPAGAAGSQDRARGADA